MKSIALCKGIDRWSGKETEEQLRTQRAPSVTADAVLLLVVIVVLVVVRAVSGALQSRRVCVCVCVGVCVCFA